MVREMKDSGVEWIGEIPREWEIIKLKKIAKIQTGNTPSKVINNIKYYCNQEDDNGFLWIKPNDLKKFQYITDSTEKLTEEGKKVAKIAPKNSILVCCIGSIGKFGIVNKEVAFNQQINSINFNSKIFFKYGVYLISSSESQHWLYSNGNVVKILNNEGQGKITCPLPQLEEQEKIANYLDRKVSDIDLIIEKTKATIEDYKKYKQSVITEAVTKGINQNIEMKDSGIEWIGNIPKEWEIKKLKYLLNSSLQYGANETGVQFNSQLPRYIRITDILLNNNLKEEGKLSLTEITAKEFILNDGDLLFARSGGTVGKTFLYQNKFGRCAFAGYLIRANLNKKVINSKFLFYYTLSNPYETWKNNIFIQSTIQNIGADKYSNLLVTIPPLEEQKQITEYLDKKTSEIDTLISKKEDLIKELEEYKKSLIYEYVTGKKEVV